MNDVIDKVCQPMRVKKEAVIEKVCQTMRVKKEAVLGHGRGQEVVCARHVAMFLMRRRCSVKTIEIATYFGVSRDTVCYAIRSVVDKIQLDQLQPTTSEPIDFKALGL